MPRPSGVKGGETATVRAILQYLHLRGYLAWRQNSRVVMLPGKGGKPAPYRMGGVKGMADIIACAPDIGPPAGSFGLSRDWPLQGGGKFIAIEVKSATGKPTPEQLSFLQAVVRAGGIGFIARNVKDVQDHGL
jgi:hypothetical protein